MGLNPASAKSASLAPGFRFHPTDEELVSYYLKRKVCGKPFRFEAISDVDVYKSEPWDLPDKSRLKSRDLEWYFFSALDRKYGNGLRTNRATDRGYWKTTGKDRAVFHRAQTVGMKKTLVYHIGRAPRGERTNWVMHEYRLVDETLVKSGILTDAFVLCRIFQKSGSGPKNGEQYGAPFVEEEWENDELVIIPGEEARREEAVGDDAYLEENDIEQIIGADITSRDVRLPFGFYSGDNGTNVSDPLDFFDDAQNLFVSPDKSYWVPDQPGDMELLSFPVQNNMGTIPVRQEYNGESSYTINSVDPDYLLDEPFFDVGNDGREYLGTSDLSNTVAGDLSYLDMVEEYLTFSDADDNLQFMGFDSSNTVGIENLVTDQSCLTQTDFNGESEQETVGSQQLLQGLDNDVASFSKHELVELGSNVQSPAVKKANRILDNIPAPPAFASEFPTKDAALLLHSASHSYNPAHITGGMIQISTMNMNGNRPDWSFGKNANVNIVLSFAMSPNVPNPTKAGPAVSRCWFYVLFVWVLILSMSCRIGSYFYNSNAA